MRTAITIVIGAVLGAVALWLRFVHIHRKRWPDHWQWAWDEFMRREQEQLQRFKRRRKQTVDRLKRLKDDRAWDEREKRRRKGDTAGMSWYERTAERPRYRCR